VHSDPEEHDPDTLPWAAGVYSEDSIIDTPIFSIEKRTIITIPDEKTLLHEVHHALDLADRDVESSSEEFLRAWNVDRRMYPGEYFARNEREGFAETWEKFYFDPLELARTQPNALAYALQDPLDYDPNADGNTRSRDFGEYTVTVELFPDGLVKHLVVTNDAGETVLETNFTRHDDGTLVAVTVENKNGQEERTVHIIRPDGTHRFERYRADGTLAETAEHDADGKLVRTEKFDEQGALVQTTEYRRFDDGSYTISTKDASGTITRVDLVDKDDHTTQTFEFDEDGNVTKRVEFEYHEDGTKKREHTFDYVADTEEDVEYNTNGSVARRTTTANGHTKTESFSYENNTTTQEIRVDGKLTTVEKTNADGSHETTVYDANENVDHIIATSADGRTVEWKRPDGSVRVRVTEDPSTGTTVRTELDPAGNVRSSTTTIEAPDGSGTTVEERDRSGALVASSTCENVGGSCRPARESFRDPATGELVTREFHYDASGVPTGSEARTAGGDLYATDERHPDGREKETKQYDASGNVVHEKRWIYGEGDELERTVDSTPTGETETYYENGVETRRIEYNADGTVEYGETYEYDASGNRIESERFDASGSVTERTTSDGSGTRRTERFEGGRLVETEVTTPTSVDRTRADGTVVSHTALNDNGQPTRTIAYDAQGNVESSTSYSYDPETGRLRTETRSTPGGPRVVTEYADDGTTTTREIPNRRGPI
jgi:antitoxin component YwqK of YwqJK toxin-antitoxin module